MKSPKRNYFFLPRIGENYQQGFNGAKTLIVGAYHICYENCQNKDLCCNIHTIKQQDYACPCYCEIPLAENLEDQLCLHNSNIIEINSYCEDEARYPVYSAFTRYMLNKKQGLTTEQKYSFWENVAFHNFYQCFSPSDLLPQGVEFEDMNKNALNAFSQLLKEINPQLIYVWTKGVSDTIDKNLKKIPGLKKESIVREHSTMEIYLYSYNYKTNTVTIQDIENYLRKSLPQRQITPNQEGEKKNFPSIEKVIFNAIKRGSMQFENGELVIPFSAKEQECGYILRLLKYYYNFKDWEEIEQIISKYKRNGEKLKNLKSLRVYNNINKDIKYIEELENNIFERI